MGLLPGEILLPGVLSARSIAGVLRGAGLGLASLSGMHRALSARGTPWCLVADAFELLIDCSFRP
jgi:hypothetical protein